MSLAELVASKRDHSGTHKLCTGLAAVVSREARVGNVHVSHSDVVVVAEGSRRRAGEAGDVIDRAVARLPIAAVGGIVLAVIERRAVRAMPSAQVGSASAQRVRIVIG